jgi:hypothetical protein
MAERDDWLEMMLDDVYDAYGQVFNMFAGHYDIDNAHYLEIDSDSI